MANVSFTSVDFDDGGWESKQAGFGHGGDEKDYNSDLNDMPNSYIKFLLDTLTGLDWNETLVDVGTGIAFGVALTISIVLNIADYRKKLKAVHNKL